MFKRKKQNNKRASNFTPKERHNDLIAGMGEVDKAYEKIKELSHEELVVMYYKAEDKDDLWDRDVFGNAVDDFNVQIKHFILTAFKERFIFHVGVKAFVRYEYVVIDGHTQEEFDDYWDSLDTVPQLQKTKAVEEAENYVRNYFR